MDWVAALHKHHDHSIGICEIGQRRFSENLICGQCNSTEGVVKRKLKLPPKFSFSPQEMRTFIQATPHANHTIDYELALSLYNALKYKNLFNLE